MDYRTCSKCGVSKPETVEFFRKRGHHCRGGLRPDCIDCTAKRDREYYANNREKFEAYRRENAEQIAISKRAIEARYKETEAGKASRKRAAQKYRQTEGGKMMFRLARHRRAARLAAVRNDFTEADWEVILDLFGHRCAYCGLEPNLLDVLYQEHVVPITSGGPNSFRNVIPACRPCNSRKFQFEMVEWFRRQSSFTEDRLAAILAHCDGPDVEAIA